MKNIAKAAVVGLVLVPMILMAGCARRCGEPCGPVCNPCVKERICTEVCPK